MAKDRSLSFGSFLQEIIQLGAYKSSQGRIARQATFAAMALVFVLLAWRLHGFMTAPTVRVAVPVLIFALGAWLSYRLVNFSKFADFLIAVESEMNKVSWPAWTELVRASLVVIFVIFGLAFVLLLFDTLWQIVFTQILGVWQ